MKITLFQNLITVFKFEKISGLSMFRIVRNIDSTEIRTNQI